MSKAPNKPAISSDRKAPQSAKAASKPASNAKPAKPSAPNKSASVMAAPKTDSPFKPTIVEAAQPVLAGPMMRKKELIETVVAQSGVKKRDAKPVIEAMLSVLGNAISSGRELNLEPLGKLKINRTKTGRGAKVMICKLRQSTGVRGAGPDNAPDPDTSHKEPLADTDE